MSNIFELPAKISVVANGMKKDDPVVKNEKLKSN